LDGHSHGANDADIGRVAEAVLSRRPSSGPYIVGVTGSVASGKSTLARALAEALERGQDSPRVELIATDGFLLPNATLAARGLEMRKGFPESYDLEALAESLRSLRIASTLIPTYSHVRYDVDPDAARRIEPPDIVVVEGLALGLERSARPPQPTLVDSLVYLDASEEDLEAWFVARFLAFWEAAATDPTSFYTRFRHLDRDGAASVARAVWTAINLPNLRDHIASVRPLADLVVRKRRDHGVVDIVSRPVLPSEGAP